MDLKELNAKNISELVNSIKEKQTTELNIDLARNTSEIFYRTLLSSGLLLESTQIDTKLKIDQQNQKNYFINMDSLGYIGLCFDIEKALGSELTLDTIEEIYDSSIGSIVNSLYNNQKHKKNN